MYRAWEQCVSSGAIDQAIISPMIARSWRRCLEKGVDHHRITTNCLSAEELSKRIRQLQKLIEVTSPFMQNLYQFVRGSGFVVILLDREGYILELVGDREIIERYEHFRQGENWREEYKGTNAMGLILHEQAPLQVFATEHFCKLNHTMTCSAAPISDVNGELLGILDVSGDYRKAHSHTLGMVVAAVRAVENQLRLEQASAEVLHSYRNITAIMESMSEGVISFDVHGIITRINAVAGSMLGVPAGQWVGRPLEVLLQTAEVQEALLRDGRIINDQELFIDTQRGRLQFLISGRPIRGDGGSIHGGVITVREIKSVRTLVTRMVGAQARFTFDDITGNSRALRDAVELARRVARGNASVLLQGESGTGKEMFAQAIHNASDYRRGPFVAINCGAIPRDLMESELFGYEEGAFTGARRGGRPGKFELANGGTIFLDEIGDMPLETQVALLRVLQEKQAVRVGGSKAISVEIRVIAATNKDLLKEVKKGNFRQDLFYRLSVIPVYIPALRERGDDILTLARYFAQKLGRQLGKAGVILAPEVEQVFMQYAWPGNVRELGNAIERAVNVAPGNVIEMEHLPEKIRWEGKMLVPTSKQAGIGQLLSLEEAEKKVILDTLQMLNGNISRSADILGISRNTLYRKIRDLGVDLRQVL
ncbi:hypothetical protein SY88_21045 [Clostridiales bacterium PH28_bin88]|nr:hypothetical protein SY88_21045 [Clostridiales bacterium PH28_bin88]